MLDILWWSGGLQDSQERLGQLTNDFQLLTTDSQRQEAFDTYASLYSNRRVNPNSKLLANFAGDWAMKVGKYSRVPYNLMKLVIDEATARITKSHPHAKFMTIGGNRSAKRKATYMQRWNDGELYKLKTDETFDLVIKDSCQYGLGALKHMKAYRESRLNVMRVYPGNLFVDLEETAYEKPQRLHHRRFVSKSMLVTMFPKFEKEIRDSDSVSTAETTNQNFGYNDAIQDQVELVESWHLPTFVEDGKSPDGVRYLWISGAILQKSVYNRRRFPFSFFNWKTDPTNTFYGIGLGEDLLGVHVDCNVTLNRINNAIEAIANPHILAKKGSKISKSSITNAAGAIFEWQGNDPPQVVLPQTVPGDLLQYVREHEARAYRIAGLSSNAAQGDNVSNSLQTGRAVENYFAAESVPFNEQLRKFEKLVEQVAENNIAAGRDIWEHDKSYTVVLPGDKNSIEELNWSQVSLDIENEMYLIRVAPVSALSEIPSVRLSEVERMINMGVITDPGTMRDLINIPDLEAEDDYVSAAKRNIDRMIELATDGNIFTPPSPQMDLSLLKIRATQAEQKGQDQGIPEANLGTIRRLIRRAEELIQRQALAAQAASQGAIVPGTTPQDPGSGVNPNALQATPGQQ